MCVGNATFSHFCFVFRGHPTVNKSMSESTVTLPPSTKKVQSACVKKEQKCSIYWIFFNVICAFALLITLIAVLLIQKEDFKWGDWSILYIVLGNNIFWALRSLFMVKRRTVHEIAINEYGTLYVMYNKKNWKRYGPVRSARVGCCGQRLAIRYERSSCLDIYPCICFCPMGMDAQQCKTYLGLDELQVGAITAPMAKVDV